MITIQIASEKDIEELTELLVMLFSQDIEFVPNRDKQKKGLGQIILNPSVGEIFTIRENDKILGMVSLLYSVSTALGGKVATLEDMIIAPNYRRTGVGTKLLNYVIDYAKKSEVLRITLLTDFDNEPAINYYQQNGFVKSAMIPMRQLF